jgi:hypothetical protein
MEVKISTHISNIREKYQLGILLTCCEIWSEFIPLNLWENAKFYEGPFQFKNVYFSSDFSALTLYFYYVCWLAAGYLKSA